MKKILLWIAAILITLSSAVYQRLTGPTYPKKYSVELEDTTVSVELLRSHGGESDAEILLEIPDSTLRGKVYFQHYPTDNEEWEFSHLLKTGKGLVAVLPNQPPAGKLKYYIELSSGGKKIPIAINDPVIIRYKGAVPNTLLIPHVLAMFFAMLLSNVAGLFAIGRIKSFRIYTFIAFILLLTGGMILGPVVQKYAFGEYWTGIPHGWDLTDNKTLIAFVAWTVAVIGNIKKPRPTLTIIASIVLLLIYLIPHSMFGSELDRESGEITQGIIYLLN